MKSAALALALALPPLNLFAQSILGKWTTVDDATGEEKSVVEIYQKDGAVYGRIVRIFPAPGDDPDPLCTECPGDDDRYNKKIIGMEIIRGLRRTDEEQYGDGSILDPESGRVYRCRLWVEQGALMVRGYWGPFYRTQRWKRALARSGDGSTK